MRFNDNQRDSINDILNYSIRNLNGVLVPVKEVINISANPKYGSEKKGAPTNYFMVAAPERVRVNCDLHHVDTVLCCDPKIFLHTNPLDGIAENGSFVWESNETSGEKEIGRAHV